MTFTYRFIESPVGQLKLIAKGARLAAVLWPNDRPNRVLLGPMDEDSTSDILEQTAQQLSEYFAGRRQAFDLALEFHGTDFQRRVWQALLSIPFGETRSYLDIAAQIGNPAAVRAVGAANGKNPISIIAPCHRVIGNSGALTGFAGGLDAKQLLLTLEGYQPALRPKRVVKTAVAQGSLF